MAMPRVSRDAALVELSADDIFVALKTARRGDQPDRPEGVAHVLRRAGLTDEDGSVTAAGQALHKARWILRQEDRAREALARSVRPLLPIQVMEQELRGFPPVPEEGVLELLQVHGGAPGGLTIEALRPTLREWSALGIIVYSNKMKTVRLGRLPDAGEAAPGEDDRLAVLVSPQTPYTNVVKLRRIRSEERRLGKGWDSKCRSRGAADT